MAHHMESASHITASSIFDSNCVTKVLNSSTNTTLYTGLCADILNYICNHYNLTYQVDILSVQDYGVMKADGNWTGMVNPIRSGLFQTDNDPGGGGCPSEIPLS